MIEPWQVPILVMGALVALRATWDLVLRWWGTEIRRINLVPPLTVLRDYWRTSSLALPTILVGGLALGFFGPATIGTTQVVSAITAVIVAVVTVRTFKRERDREYDRDGVVGGAPTGRGGTRGGPRTGRRRASGALTGRSGRPPGPSSALGATLPVTSVGSGGGAAPAGRALCNRSTVGGGARQRADRMASSHTIGA